jgi:GNAT superfamily N-acetyltransferase
VGGAFRGANVIVVRQIGPEDAASLRTVRLRALQDYPADFSAALEEEAAFPLERWAQWTREVTWFLAERGGETIGCAFLRRPQALKLRHNGWVHGVYVGAQAQGSRAGAELMAAIEREARAQGVTILKLLTRAGNARAERFYQRCGFTAYGREPATHKVAGVVYDSIEMAKRLD